MRKNFEPAADYVGLRRQYEALTKLHAITCDELAESIGREKKALAALRRERAERNRSSVIASACRATWKFVKGLSGRWQQRN